MVFYRTLIGIHSLGMAGIGTAKMERDIFDRLFPLRQMINNELCSLKAEQLTAFGWCVIMPLKLAFK